MTTDIKQRSKHLAFILRHRPDTVGLALDRDGWVLLDALLAATRLTREEVEEVVTSDAKGRYTLDAGPPARIRANQGHTAKGVSPAFRVAVPPVVLYHGTTDLAADAILKKGLLPMKRTHVHLSSDIETARSVGGRRKGVVTIFQVDAKQAFADGVKFFLSDNNVWLVRHLPPKYLRRTA